MRKDPVTGALLAHAFEKENDHLQQVKQAFEEENGLLQ
jgi:hypothetical protein